MFVYDVDRFFGCGQTAGGKKQMVTIKQMSDYGSKQFGIYLDGTLIEGGFFSRGSAVNYARNNYAYTGR
jgi:hypothetical protein